MQLLDGKSCTQQIRHEIGELVVDVGQTHEPDASKLSGCRSVGDVDSDNVKDKCTYITFVTGGVGPLTRASLLQNTLKAHQRR